MPIINYVKNFIKNIIPCIIHTRLITIPTFFLFFGLSYSLAINFSWDFYKFSLFVAAVLIFGFFGNGGACALNTYYDKDEGDIGFLTNPPPVTKYLLYFSWVIYLIGLFLSYFINWRFFAGYLAYFILTVAYSHPWIRFKKYPIWNNLANGVGFGIIFYSGWALASIPLNWIIILLCISMVFWMMAYHPLHCIYHYEEDLKRGDKTLAILLGKKNTVLFSIISSTITFIILFYIIIKWYFSYLTLAVLAIGYIYETNFLMNWYRNIDKFKKANLRKLTNKALLISVTILFFLILSLYLFYYSIP